jgi:hypothetical protein
MNIAHIEIKNVETLIKLRSELIPKVQPIGLADTAAYCYSKDVGFFGKKDERLTFTFFQGLNTNPQNLSLFLRDKVARVNKQSK